MSAIIIKAMCVIRYKDKLLLHHGIDDAKGESFLRPFGGHIEFGEKGVDAIRREIKEETGTELTDVRLLEVKENLFTYHGEPAHEIIFFYAGNITDGSVLQKGTFSFTDGERTIEAGWFSKEDVEKEGLAIYPPFSYFS